MHAVEISRNGLTAAQNYEQRLDTAMRIASELVKCLEKRREACATLPDAFTFVACEQLDKAIDRLERAASLV
jgi:hypothetical protein